MTPGTVVGISVYPVRGCAGTALPRADVGPAGLAGDRASAVVDADGRVAGILSLEAIAHALQLPSSEARSANELLAP